MDRFEKQISYLIEHPYIDVLGTDLNIVDQDNKLIALRQYKSNNKEIKKIIFIHNRSCASLSYNKKKVF